MTASGTSSVTTVKQLVTSAFGRNARWAAAALLSAAGMCAVAASCSSSSTATVDPCVSNGGTCVPTTDTLACGTILSFSCSTSGETCCSVGDAAGQPDSYVAVPDTGTPGIDATLPEAGASDAATPSFAIVAVSGAALTAAAGDAIPLKVVRKLDDGGTADLPAGTTVTWALPATVAAEDPDDAGDNGTVPDAGGLATGFFVDNPFRADRTDYSGTLFIIGAGGDAGISVTATIGDAGSASAVVSVTPTPAGNADAGAHLYTQVLNCAQCHGATGGGSPGVDGGAEAGVVYLLEGHSYSYPAPALNNTSTEAGPNLAADPAWNAALLSMAAQADIDNGGIALRAPMPDWLGKKNADGGTLSAQDFAHVYAFLQTQTK